VEPAALASAVNVVLAVGVVVSAADAAADAAVVPVVRVRVERENSVVMANH
jgi:hypothetical protein